MKKEMTLYEKAIEKEKEIDKIVATLGRGKSKMWNIDNGDDSKLDTIFGEAFKYVNIVIRRDLRNEIIITAKRLALAELKKVRQAAAEEARGILADCEKKEIAKKIQDGNEYYRLRCKKCGAYIPKTRIAMVDAAAGHSDAWRCTNCGELYYNKNEISYKVIEIY